MLPRSTCTQLLAAQLPASIEVPASGDVGSHPGCSATLSEKFPLVSGHGLGESEPVLVATAHALPRDNGGAFDEAE